MPATVALRSRKNRRRCEGGDFAPRMKNWELIKSLHARGASVTKLARALSTSHAQISMVLNNTLGRGHLTRPKLAKLLTPDELALVGWDPEGRQITTAVEQSSTGNNEKEK